MRNVLGLSMPHGSYDIIRTRTSSQARAALNLLYALRCTIILVHYYDRATRIPLL